MQRYRTILFDFDGTLADTREVALKALNAVAPEFGFAPVREEEIPALRNMSAKELLVKRAGIPLWKVWKIVRLERRVREELARCADEVKLFAGIPETIRELRAQGFELGIVTSNSLHVVEATLKRAGVEVDLVHAGSRFFGKARALRAALDEYDIGKEHTLYVGDELRDVAACKKVGIDFLGVGWGFNAPEALRASGAKVASTPKELLALIATK